MYIEDKMWSYNILVLEFLKTDNRSHKEENKAIIKKNSLHIKRLVHMYLPEIHISGIMIIKVQSQNKTMWDFQRLWVFNTPE